MTSGPSHGNQWNWPVRGWHLGGVTIVVAASQLCFSNLSLKSFVKVTSLVDLPNVTSAASAAATALPSPSEKATDAGPENSSTTIATTSLANVEVARESREEILNELRAFHSDHLVSQFPPSWNFIGYNRQPNGSKACRRFERPGERLPEHKYWPGINQNEGEYLYATVWGQEQIWKHQHPADCQKAKLVLAMPHFAGIGSLVRMAALHLKYAMQEGLVLAWHPAAKPFWLSSWCQRVKTMDCYLEPLTNCTVDLSQVDHLPKYEGFKRKKRKKWPPELPELQEMLQCSPLDRSMDCMWFNLQAMAYIFRPNSAALQALREYKHRLWPAKFQEPRNTGDTISVYVRHAKEKEAEAQLLPSNAYWKAASVLRRANPALKRLFVSSEDPEVISSANELKDWEVTYVNVERKNQDAYHRNQGSTNRHRHEEFFASTLNLELALKSDAWICNRFSNWCQLTDAIRLTQGRKANCPLLDNGGLCKKYCKSYLKMICGI